MENEEIDILDENLSDDEYLEHYGTPRHSGRYPWGSGDSPYQHSTDFYVRVNELRKQGMSDTEIAKSMGLSTTNFRSAYSVAKNNYRSDRYAQARSLADDGKTPTEIAKIMGIKNESSVRSLLNEDSAARMSIASKTAENLKQLVNERGMIDVGAGAERQLGISDTKMKEALAQLEMEGYEVYGGRVPYATNPSQGVTIKVLCPPGTEHKEIFDYENVHSITDLTSDDNGNTLRPSFIYPKSLNSERLMVKYAEDGGLDKDGVVEIRRGVADLDLGNSNYAQVRILVDGTHYIKGMAVYSDDIPEGYDLIFNTNKPMEKGKMAALKKIKDDPENPFGSAIKEDGGQYFYTDENGIQQQSLINKRADAGDWGMWSKQLPSQFLSKQPMKLINQQLDLASADKEDEFEEIMKLENPVVKRNLLNTFADDCDSASVQLKAAALPGQKYQVILPLTTTSDNECYAPNYDDGATLALIRYPHGGTFEIPIVKVNNRNEEGKKVIGPDAPDAIGINAKIAQRLSGADFDGDTVMVIPVNSKTKIVNREPLEGLKGFDPTVSYGPDREVTDDNGNTHYYRGKKEIHVMKNTQIQMGMVSNLITDMTLQGATDDELEKIVRHSMVVIDAEKHHLDYQQSAIDNDYQLIRTKYQSHIDPDTGKVKKGASTLISKAKNPKEINERKPGAFYTKDGLKRVVAIDEDELIFKDEDTGEYLSRNKVKVLNSDPKTGEKVYRDTNRIMKRAEVTNSEGKTKKVSVIEKDGSLYFKDPDDGKYTKVTDKNAKLIFEPAKESVSKMSLVDDALILSSGTKQEQAYGKYANNMKNLAKKARLEADKVIDIPYSKAARNLYKDEVQSLEYKLNIAELNAPRERRAQSIAASQIKAYLQENPTLTTEEQYKKRQQFLTKARANTGAKKERINITDNEWKAIQAGAVSTSKLQKIIDNADKSRVRELASPNKKVTLTPARVNRIKALSNSGYTNAEIAAELGLSTSTIISTLKGE